MSKIAFLSGLLAIVPLITVLSGETDDPYLLAVVSGLLKNRGSFSTGWEEKSVARLGDKSSIALVKLFSKDDWNNSDMVRKALRIIRDSFSYPELIEGIYDREPKVTILVLSHLRAIQKDPKIVEEINDAERQIRILTDFEK